VPGRRQANLQRKRALLRAGHLGALNFFKDERNLLLTGGYISNNEGNLELNLYLLSAMQSNTRGE
jgi:hypothetical protein